MSTQPVDLDSEVQAGKPGRPTSYQTSMLPIVRNMAKAGCTELDIADALEINTSTLWQWKSRYPRFNNALNLGRAQSTKRVERALYHRAVGYSHDAVKIFNDKGEPVIVPYREHVPPDTNAAIFWLKNRKPDEWQDRSNLDVTGSLNVVASTLSLARQRLLTAKSTLPTLIGDSADIAEVQDAGDAEAVESE